MKISKKATIKTILLAGGVVTAFMFASSIEINSLEQDSAIETTAQVAEESTEPQQMINIQVEDRLVGYFYYDNFYTEVKRIMPTEGVGYSLEVYKQYSTTEGIEEFDMYNSTDNVVNNILAQGYPKKTALELNLKSDDEAYLATQVALWTIKENFELDKVTTNDPYVDHAVKKIYNAAMENLYNMDTENNTFVYKHNDSISEVAVYADDSIMEPIDINKNIAPDGFIIDHPGHKSK